jgi:hypothetical protein
MKTEHRVIWESDDSVYRIIEVLDLDADLANLKGDCYEPKLHPDIDPEELKRQEAEFEDLVGREGVFGYVLERWNPKPGGGYEHIDSCFGFVGQYAPSDRSGLFNHYIVDELKREAADLILKKGGSNE